MGWLQRLLGRDALPAAQPTGAPASGEPGWQQLASIEGTFPPPELTLRPARFEAELTTRRNPGLIGSMLHDVSMDGPAGYVAAAAQPPQSAPLAEGIVRFPPPPPQLSRLGAAAEAAPTLPETAPQLLPSFPEPPPSGPSPVTAAEVPVGVMRFPVHDTGPASGPAATPPTAASPGSQSAGVLSSAGRNAGSPSASSPRPQPPSSGQPSDGDPIPSEPGVSLPGVQRAVQLPEALGSPSAEDAVESRSGRPQVPGSQDATARRDVGLAPPPLTVSFGSTPSLVDTPARPAPDPPPMTVPPAVGRQQAHGGPAPGSEPAVGPRRLQRYRLGEPQTLGHDAPVPPLPGLSPMNRLPAGQPAAGQPPTDAGPSNGPPAGGPPTQSSSSRLPSAPASPRPPLPASPAPDSDVSPAPPGTGAAPLSRPVPSLPLQTRALRLPPEAEGPVAAAPARPVSPTLPAAGDRAGSGSGPAPLTLVAPRSTETTGPLLGELPSTLSVPFDPALPPEGPAPLLAEPAGVEAPAVHSESAGKPTVPTRAILAQRDVVGPASSPATPWTRATTSADRRLEQGGETRGSGGGRLPAGGGDLAPLQRASLQRTGEPLLTAPEGTVIVFPGPDGRPPGAADRAGETAASMAQLLTLQRQDDPAAAVAPASGGGAPAPAASPSSSSSPAPGAAPGAGGGDADLDELGRRLYDRIRDHLTAELAIDRERAGLLNDLGNR